MYHDDAHWRYRCITCGAQGDMVGLLHKLYEYDCNWTQGHWAMLLLVCKQNDVFPSAASMSSMRWTHHYNSGERAKTPADTYIAYLIDLYEHVGKNWKTPKKRIVSLGEGVSKTPHEAVAALFNENKKLFAMTNCEYRDVRYRDEWAKEFLLSGLSFISSSYLKDEAGSTGAAQFDGRVWLVVEGDGDRLNLDQQIAVHDGLDGHLDFNLRLTVWSGNESIHGWYSALGKSEDDCFAFYKSAIGLGMDFHCFQIQQPVRLPGGWNHKTNQRQKILKWNL